MRIILISNLLLCSLSLSNVPNYHNKKIVSLLYEYFMSTKDAPKLLGHSFHKKGYDNVFQVEIECNSRLVNQSLLFSFKAINMLTKFSKENFTHSILIIHFENSALPVVAESSIGCTEKFLNPDNVFEDNWRKNCLTIKNY